MWELFHQQRSYYRADDVIVKDKRIGPYLARESKFPRFAHTTPAAFAMITLLCLSHQPAVRPEFRQILKLLEGLLERVRSGQVSIGDQNIQLSLQLQRH